MDLAEFLLARLAEDFEVAQRENTWPNGKPISAADWDRVAGDADSMLVSMFSPARVLAEVEAKRVILNIHSAPPPPEDEERWGPGLWPNRCLGCGTIPPCDDPITEDRDNCPVLQALALPYADHPECHPSWLPAIKARP
jgi:hypothetical protein